MNKTLSKILFLTCCSLLTLFAFEDEFTSPVDFSNLENIKNQSNYLSANPASIQFDGNIETLSFGLNYHNNAFKRLYDPSVVQDISISYYTLRQINDKSFFAAGISYDDLRLKDMWGSREKYFYDDYFSIVDSSSGNTAYYGPRLNFLYNVELAKDLFLGLQGDYGVERGLKDTFPQTITIMRNSSFRLGLDYRKESFGFGLHARYYDDQTHYESVKFYVDVRPKTFMGYNVYYNELSSSTSKKKRVRKGLESGLHFRIGRTDKRALNISASYLHRTSAAEIYTSYSKPRGYWERSGLHLKGDLVSHMIDDFTFRLYGDYLTFKDWGKSMISNTLILENKENYLSLGAHILYQPTPLGKTWVGAEAGSVDYDYVEYLFPFEDQRSGLEWNVYAGTEQRLSSKTTAGFKFNYEQTVPKFYWDIDYFKNTGIGIMLEHLFTFGYIGTNIEYIKQNPSNNEEFNSKYQLTLTYRRK